METALDILVSLTSVGIVASYAWSMKKHFAAATLTRDAILLSLVVNGTNFLFLYLMWARHQSAALETAGLVVELAAWALFWWAISATRAAKLRFAFDPELPHGLVSEGPYRYFRHPFYSSYLTFWIGYAVATGVWWAVVPVVVFFFVYRSAAASEERNFEKSPMAEEYGRFKRRTGYPLPRFTSV